MKNFLLVLTLLCSAVFADMPLMFSDAKVPMPPPGAKVAAGFLKIENHSSKDIKIVSASSEQFERVEFHLSVVENDIAKMIKQPHLAIEAGSSLELKHGSYHLMLMGIKQPLEAGQTIPVILETDDASVHTVELEVAMPGAHHMGGDKSGHGMKHSDGKADKSMKMEHDSTAKE